MLHFAYSPHRIGFGVLLSLVLITAGFTNTAVAAETKNGAPKTVPNQLLRKMHGQYENKLKEIAALAAAEEEKIRKVASKEEIARLQQLASESKKISDMPAGKSRTNAIAAFNQKNRDFGRELEKRAGITIESRQRQFEKVYPKRPLRRVEGEALQSTEPYYPPYSSNSYSNSSSGTGSTPSSESEHDIDIWYFPVASVEGACGNNLPTNPANFTLDARSLGVAIGGCSQMKLLGTYVTVPPNTHRVRYQLELSAGYSLESSAAAFLGFSLAAANLGTIVQGPGVESTSVTESLIAIAPLAFLMNLNKSQSTYVVSGEFEPDSAGGEYLVQAYVEASALAIAGGASIGSSAAERVYRLAIDFD